MPWAKADMRAACADVANGVSVRKAAFDNEVPYSTLRGRLRGQLPHAVAHQDQQRLSMALEDDLADWVLFQASIGAAPTHSQIKGLAQRIFIKRGEGSKIGKRWIRHFLNRHPVLKTQRPRRVGTARLKCATEDIIRPWFNYLGIPSVHTIPPQYRWNVNKAGLQEGIGSNGYVVGSSERRAIAQKKPDSRT